MRKNIVPDLRKAIKFGTWGAVGGSIGALLSESIQTFGDQGRSASLTESLIYVGTWFGIIGASIAVALLIANSQYFNRGLQVKQSLKGGIWVGLLAGVIAGGIAQYTYRSIGPTEFLRVICWGIAGGLLGFGLSFRLPNLGQLRGAGGGFAGGILGGVLFISIAIFSGGSETAARLLGTAAIGFCIGLAIIIIEAVFREAWLEIRYSSNESRTISLGTQPVTIGSDPALCTVYVRNAPSLAQRYQLIQGQIICEEVSTRTARSVHPGDQQVLGNVIITVCGVALPSKFTSSSSSPSLEAAQKHLHITRKQSLLQIKHHVITLTDGTHLTANEIPGLETQRPDGLVAEVSYSPKDPTVLGLKNCSIRPWIATVAGGQKKQIDSGRSIKLAVGTRIDFGSVDGEIKG